MDLWTSAAQFLGSQLSWSSARGAFAVLIAGIVSQVSTVAGFAHPSIPFLAALVIIDFVLAAGIALHEDRYTWSGFRHGFGKFVAYAMIFLITSLADNGMGIAGWMLNLTVGVSCYAIAGESISCLRHIDHIFPGRLPPWLIRRLETVRASMDRDAIGTSRRKDDWRGHWNAGEVKRDSSPREAGSCEEGDPLNDCRGRIPDDDDDDESRRLP